METSELRRRLSEMEVPTCAALTPFTLEAVDAEAARVTVLFAAQPTFGNHFQQVQGGFAAAMIDTIVSLCGYAATGRWLPTAALDLLFLNPVPLAPCYGTASMLKIGGKLCFADARLFEGDRVYVTAQATLAYIDP
jgi:acyl-coenzyme A thioesterase PaaI-like protein